jgi:small-conductance mechanosensitive channel
MEKIQNILLTLVKDPTSRDIIFGIILTIIAALVFLYIVRLTNKYLQKAQAMIESGRGTRIPPLKIQTFEVLSADRLTDMLKKIAKVVRIAALVLVLYIFIPLIFSFFELTRGLLPKYLPYIVAPFTFLLREFLAFIPNLFFITVIVVITRYILKFMKSFFAEIQNKNIAFPGFYYEWAEPTSKLLRVLIVVFAIVLISPYLPGFGSPAFQGISIFFGVLLSLGSTVAIANIIAGVAITYMRPFSIGDRVKIADTVGDVVEKTLLITRIRTVKNVEVTIPNAMILSTHLINFSALAQEMGLILYTSVTIGYDVDWRKVHELLLSAAHSTGGASKEPAPFVLQTSLNDFAVAYELNVYIKDAKDLAKIKSELHQNLQDKFNEAGIEIMSPTFSAIRDGNDTVLPDDYLPKTSSTSKGFKILPVENLSKIRGEDPSST